MKKAIVFDNSGTLIERYRVIKDVFNGDIFTNINSLELIDSADSLALVVLQFNTNKLLKLDSNTLISDVIKQYNIDFDVSFSTSQVSKAEIKSILDDETTTTISDITDGFEILGEKIPHMELCNGSALIVDIDLGQVAYTITISLQVTEKEQLTDWPICSMFPRTMHMEQFQLEAKVKLFPFLKMPVLKS